MPTFLHAHGRHAGEQAREPSSGSGGPRPPRRPRMVYRLRFLERLRLPCYVCEGSGRLFVVDPVWPRGRFARCVACLGQGKLPPRRR